LKNPVPVPTSEIPVGLKKVASFEVHPTKGDGLVRIIPCLAT
jgi:hypothetical protein